MAVVLVIFFASLVWCLLRRHKASASGISLRLLDESVVGEQELKPAFWLINWSFRARSHGRWTANSKAKRRGKKKTTIMPIELDSDVTVGSCSDQLILEHLDWVHSTPTQTLARASNCGYFSDIKNLAFRSMICKEISKDNLEVASNR